MSSSNAPYCIERVNCERTWFLNNLSLLLIYLESLMNIIMNIGVNNLEEIYTNEEQNFIGRADTVFVAGLIFSRKCIYLKLIRARLPRKA